MAEDKREREELKEKPMSFMTLVVITGLVGGIVISSIAQLAYVFNLTAIPARVILEPWALGDWKKEWLGTIISIILIGVVSMVAAIIYYVTLRKMKSMWVGIAYGLVLFLLVFLVLNPLFPGIAPFRKIDLNTIITSICCYVLFGLFVGFTISYEENEIHERKRIREEDGVPST